MLQSSSRGGVLLGRGGVCLVRGGLPAGGLGFSLVRGGSPWSGGRCLPGPGGEGVSLPARGVFSLVRGVSAWSGGVSAWSRGGSPETPPCTESQTRVKT